MQLLNQRNLITGYNEYGQVDDEIAEEGLKWDLGSQKKYRIALDRDVDHQTFKSDFTILSDIDSESNFGQSKIDIRRQSHQLKDSTLSEVPRVNKIFDNDDYEVNITADKATRMSDLNKSNSRHLRWTGEISEDDINLSTVNTKGRNRSIWNSQRMPKKVYIDKFDYESSEDIIPERPKEIVEGEFIEAIRKKDS